MKNAMELDYSGDKEQHVGTAARDQANPSHELVRSASSGRSVGNLAMHPPSVVIVGPPYPRSGAALVIKSQIDYYRVRGFNTVLVIVPFHRAFMRSSPLWDEIGEGIRELGAHRSFVAPLDENRYKMAKYTASMRHVFTGTALDWQFAMGNSVRLPEDLIQLLRCVPVALLHVNYVQTLGFALRLRKKLEGRHARMPIILETHDVQSHLLQERHGLNPWTRKLDLLERTIHSELSLLGKVDVLVHLSVDDFHFFQTRMPGKPHVLALPAIDETYISTVNATAPLKDTIDLLFVGQKHATNLAAIEWFFDQVWPLLAEKRYNLKIVGPVDVLVRESLPRLFEVFRSCFVGQVADVAPYYSSARCVIAPMVSGSGTSMKTIEALALGKPFVGTVKAFRGMPIERINAAGVQSHDTPRAFADAVVSALADTRRPSAQSRAAYDRVFSVQANFASRDDAVRVATTAKK